MFNDKYNKSEEQAFEQVKTSNRVLEVKRQDEMRRGVERNMVDTEDSVVKIPELNETNKERVMKENEMRRGVERNIVDTEDSVVKIPELNETNKERVMKENDNGMVSHIHDVRLKYGGSEYLEHRHPLDVELNE